LIHHAEELRTNMRKQMQRFVYMISVKWFNYWAEHSHIYEERDMLPDRYQKIDLNYINNSDLLYLLFSCFMV